MLSIKFTDGELVTNVDWNSLPMNKVIRYMDYKIGNRIIRFMGYDRYLRLKEMVYGVNIKLDRISKVILIGQHGSMCTKVTLDLLNNQCLKEEILFTELYNGKEIADNFWRPGEIIENPNVYLSRD